MEDDLIFDGSVEKEMKLSLNLIRFRKSFFYRQEKFNSMFSDKCFGDMTWGRGVLQCACTSCFFLLYACMSVVKKKGKKGKKIHSFCLISSRVVYRVRDSLYFIRFMFSFDRYHYIWMCTSIC